MAQVQIRRNDTNQLVAGQPAFDTAGSCLQDAIDWVLSEGLNDTDNWPNFTDYGGLTFSCQGNIGQAELSRIYWGSDNQPTAGSPIIIEPDAGFWHNGLFGDDTNGAYIVLSSGAGLKSSLSYTTIRGIRIVSNGDISSDGIVIDTAFGDHCTVFGNIVEANIDTRSGIYIGHNTAFVLGSRSAYCHSNLVRCQDGSVGVSRGIQLFVQRSGSGTTTLNVSLLNNTVRSTFDKIGGGGKDSGVNFYFRAYSVTDPLTAILNVDMRNNVGTYDGADPGRNSVFNVSNTDGVINLLETSTKNAENDGSIDGLLNPNCNGSTTDTISSGNLASNFTSATDYRLVADGSPSLVRAGANGAPEQDAVRNAFKSPPSIGAFEISSADSTRLMLTGVGI
jgi:hypothetical protein